MFQISTKNKPVPDVLKLIIKANYNGVRLLFSSQYRGEVGQSIDRISEQVESVMAYFLVEFEKARENNPGISDSEAAYKVAKTVIENAFNKLYIILEKNYYKLGCYNPAIRAQKLCKVISDFTVPPAAFFIALSKGYKVIKSKMDLSHESTKKTPKPTTVNQRESSTKVNGDPPPYPQVTSSTQDVMKSAFHPPVNPNDVETYNLSNILFSRELLSTSYGSKKYQEAANKVENRSEREKVVGTELTEKLGSGFNGEVFLGADGSVYKFPLSAKGAFSLKIEDEVAKLLQNNFKIYGIRVLNNDVVNKEYMFIKKAKVEKEYLATEILKRGSLNDEQLKALEDLFYRARIFANKTGIGLDLKAENLYWNPKVKAWVLLEAGPRTSYLPYGFTLDVENFDQYKRIWHQGDPPHDIEKPNNRKLFEQYSNLNDESLALVRSIEQRPPEELTDSILSLIKNDEINPIARTNALSAIPPDVKAKALAQKIEISNSVDVVTPLNIAISRSGLNENNLGTSLYQATRFSRTHDYIDFLKIIHKELKNENIVIFNSSELSNPLRYLNEKTHGVFPSLRFRFRSVDNVNEIAEPTTLLMSSEELLKHAKDENFVNAIKNNKHIKILVNDQISSGINPFNFKNPERIQESLKFYTEDRYLDAKSEMVKLGIGKSIRPIYYDPELPVDSRISFTKPKNQISVSDAVSRISPPKLSEDQIMNKLETSLNDPNRINSTLDLSLTNLHLESIQKTNERIGVMLNQVRSYAETNNLNHNLYFYIPDPNTELGPKSYQMIEKILTDSYGIPKERILRDKSPESKIPLNSKQAPIILVVDDFVGSGTSLEYSMDQANFYFHNAFQNQHENVSPVIHAFAPFMTETGKRKLSDLSSPFVNETVPAFEFAYGKKRSKEYQQLVRNGLRDQSPSFGTKGTAIGFEYMGPDNNLPQISPLLELWTVESGIKSKLSN